MKRVITLVGVTMLLLAMSLTSTLGAAFAAEDDLNTAKSYTAVYGTATVDGEVKADEWNAAAKEAVNRLANGDTHNGTGENTKTDGCTASFSAMWDEQNFYLLIEIDDDQLDTKVNGTEQSGADSKSFRSDSVWLFFGLADADGNFTNGIKTDNVESWNDATNFHLNAFPYKTEGEYDNFEVEGQKGALFPRNNAPYDCSKVAYKCKTTEKDGVCHIVMEFAFPAASLGLTTGKELKFDIQYNDVNVALYGDGVEKKLDNSNKNRETVLVWSGAGTNAKGPSNSTANRTLWGSVTLAEKPSNPGTTTPGGNPGTTTPGGDSGTTTPGGNPGTGDLTVAVVVLSSVALVSLAAVAIKRKKN